MAATQNRLYVINEKEGGGVEYNMPSAIEMKGQLDGEKVQQVFSKLIARHEALRTSFAMVNGEAVQIIAESANGTVEFERIEKTDKEAKKKILQNFVRPFDLSVAPLMRVKVVNVGDEDNIVLFDIHHIISDGMSQSILTEEFIKLYNGIELPELRVQYKDYSEWMNGRDISNQEEYWTSQFSDEIPVLDMPTDFARPQYQSFNGSNAHQILSAETSKQVTEFAKKTSTTEYMVMLSALMVTLSKYSRQEDIVIGSPISGRTHRDTESMIGMFVNTLAMRGKPEKNKTFNNFLNEMKEVCLKAYENQEYPFEDLVEVVDVTRNLSRNPLFDVMFVLQNNEIAKGELDDINAVNGIEFENTVSKFDITLNATVNETGIYLNFEYCSDLFKAEKWSALRSITVRY